MPSEVRLILMLIKFLNYLWTDAMFMNLLNVEDECFFGIICFKRAWITGNLARIVMGEILTYPAKKMMYVIATYVTLVYD